MWLMLCSTLIASHQIIASRYDVYGGRFGVINRLARSLAVSRAAHFTCRCQSIPDNNAAPPAHNAHSFHAWLPTCANAPTCILTHCVCVFLVCPARSHHLVVICICLFYTFCSCSDQMIFGRNDVM